MANFIIEDLKTIFRGKENALAQIIVINVVVFIVFNIIQNFFNINTWFALPGPILNFLPKFWTIVTYMFLHAGFFHLLFNMLWLYWMGKIFIEYLNTQRFIAIYLLGGISGGLLFLLAHNLLSGLGYQSIGYGLVGASAGVMAVIFGLATLLPNYNISLFLIGQVRLKYIALGALILTTLLDFSVNTGGKIAHLGGAITGWFFVKQLQAGYDYSRTFFTLINKFKQVFYTSKNPIKVVKSTRNTNSTSTGKTTVNQQEIDAILDKISKSGYDSLTSEEKRKLFSAGNSN